MAPVKMSRYVMFKGDNGNNLCYIDVDGHEYLCFNSTNRDLWGAHEVIPVAGQEDVVTIKSLWNQRWWRRSPNWIWACQYQTPGASDKECHFKVVQLSPNKVALQCLANNQYVKRLTTEGKTNALNASAPNYTDEPGAQMEVSEAISSRRVFDVEYLTKRLEITDKKPLVLRRTTAKNESSYKSDVEVAVTYTTSKKSTWSDSTTLTTGLSMSIKAGIPEVAEMEWTVSTETTFTTAMGQENEKVITTTSTFTVKDVPPGEEVTIEVSGTEATGIVPYKYKYQDTRVDGLTMPVNTGEDGIFKGIQVVNIVMVATDSSGTHKV